MKEEWGRRQLQGIEIELEMGGGERKEERKRNLPKARIDAEK